MGKVIFSVRYKIEDESRDEYLKITRELKNLIKAEGLESYSVFEHKNKSNKFEEIYTFESYDAYEEFDDEQSERVEILMNKLTELVKENTTEYSTLYEVTNPEE